MEQERYNFEDWYFERYGNWPAQDEDGCYTTFPARAAWEAWQARAKQTITLPVKDATGEH